MRTAFVLAAAAGLGASSVAPGATVEVFVFNFDFSVNMPGSGPVEDAVIFEGDTVRWVWLTGLHSVTSVAGSSESFDSDLILPPSTFEYTFSAAGTYAYYCITHGFDNGDGTFDGMGGYVTVQPIPAPASAAALGLASALGLRRRR